MPPTIDPRLSALANIRRRQGLLADAATRRPDLFDPRSGLDTRRLDQAIQNAGQLRGDPRLEPLFPAGAETADGAAAAEMQARVQAAQAARPHAPVAAAIGREITRVAGEVPRGAESYIEEAARDTVNSQPGAPGRDFIARLFLGDVPPGLTKAQSSALRSNALIVSGLTMLASSGDPDVSFGQALALGILSARARAAETAGALLDEQRAHQRIFERNQTLNNPNLTEIERWEELRRQAVATGDTESAKIANDVLDDLRDLDHGQAERKFVQLQDGTPAFADPSGKLFGIDGEEITDFTPQGAQFETRVVDRVGPDGVARRFEVLPTGEERELGIVGRPAPQGPAQPKPGQIEAAGTARSMRAELATLQEVLERGNPGRLERLAPNEFKGEDTQRFEAAANAIAGVALKARSGATATEQEFGRIVSENIPKPGDSQRVIDEKIARINRAIENLEAQAAGQLPGGLLGEPAPSDVDAELDAIFGGGS